MNKKEETTHFGFKEIPASEKSKKVASVFHTVANQYDLMNDVMSFGIHRFWKFLTLKMSGVKAGHRILDIAGGTGDLAQGFHQKVGTQGEVYLADINASMLNIGRSKLTDKGIIRNIHYIQADAENLPFAENYFDCVSIGFGLRNVTHKEDALASIFRVLKPGGCLMVLEFSKPVVPALQSIYDAYSFKLLPKLGNWITGSEESYQYLVESIRKHPDQVALRDMILHAGFAECHYHNFTGGIVCLHRAYKA